MLKADSIADMSHKISHNSSKQTIDAPRARRSPISQKSAKQISRIANAMRRSTHSAHSTGKIGQINQMANITTKAMISDVPNPR